MGTPGPRAPMNMELMLLLPWRPYVCDGKPWLTTPATLLKATNFYKTFYFTYMSMHTHTHMSIPMEARRGWRVFWSRETTC